MAEMQCVSAFSNYARVKECMAKLDAPTEAAEEND